ncbi:MAG: alpha/beta fold hydrolase [Burkholderiales bacterium]
MQHRYRTARVGDLDIHYELADYTPPWRGTPPETFLLYHGYARNMLFWHRWVPLLAGNYRVLRLDARGCGETTIPPEGSPYTFEQLAGDAIGLMDALGIERVHWVGESSGGIVGMTAALESPDRLQTLTLCDTPFKRSAQIASTYTLGEGSRAAAFDNTAWVDGADRRCLIASTLQKLHPLCANGTSSRWTERRSMSRMQWTKLSREETSGRVCPTFRRRR